MGEFYQNQMRKWSGSVKPPEISSQRRIVVTSIAIKVIGLMTFGKGSLWTGSGMLRTLLRDNVFRVGHQLVLLDKG